MQGREREIERECVKERESECVLCVCRYISHITWRYTDTRSGCVEPADCDFLKDHPRRSFKVEISFKENPFIRDEKVWVECSYKGGGGGGGGGQVSVKSSGIAWKPDKCFTVRKRDLPSGLPD